MSAAGEHDLSGRWEGIFNYPAEFPPNGFEAILRDHGGLISGETSERDDDPHGSGGTLHAVVEGRREGSELWFFKVYDEVERIPSPIFYSGTIDPDGDEITGSWEVPGLWSGTFLMIRSRGAVETTARQASETV